jgi:ATP-binding cassette, subfamily F, member 3
LLKLLAGVLPIQSGTREIGHNVKVGYFSQYRVEMLDPKQTVLETARDMPDPVSEQTARTVLGSFLFRGDDVFKTTAVLSGGEKTRLALVRLLLDPPNLLLMDEPTTHLDVGSIDALLGALMQYKGTLIFISHDVYFIRAIAKTVLHINAGKLTPYAGDYDYYLDKSRATSARAALTSGEKLQNLQPVAPKAEPAAGDAPAQQKTGMRETREQRRAAAEDRKTEAKIKREHERRVRDLEMQILTLEGRQKELTAELEKPETYEPGGAATLLNRELHAVTTDMQRLTAEWEKLEERKTG